jgi:hypothetical protein
MIEIEPRRRWSADRCLDRGFDNGLFRRRAADDLVVGAHDPDEAAWQAEKGGDGTKTPTVASPSTEESFQRAQTGIDPEATIILRDLWKGVGAANSPSASIEGSPSGPPIFIPLVSRLRCHGKERRTLQGQGGFFFFFFLKQSIPFIVQNEPRADSKLVWSKLPLANCCPAIIIEAIPARFQLVQ